MSLLQPPYQYVFDSSALFDLKRDYPINIFPTLWEWFNDMCKEELVIAPREVLREIKNGNDELVDWAKEFDNLFLEPTDEEVGILSQVMVCYTPKIIEKHSIKPWADPFIIAAAKHYRLPILTHEKNDLKECKIPVIAAKFNIKCIKLIEFFQDQNWRF